LPQGDVPSRAKTPLAQCTVLREELKKQAAAAINSKDINPKEIVISRDEVAQALAASQAPLTPRQELDVPEFRKKIGLFDKLKYAKYPQIVKVMEKVDGKKNVEELARETKLTPSAVSYIVEKLASDGYVVVKKNM